LTKSSWQNAFNRIQSKHVDIVACDPATLDIQFVVELDDNTHNKLRRQGRDQFVDKALQAAGIPVIHVTAKKGYSVRDIQDTLSQAGVLTKT
jgi:very-short-patch-repair endonuclease